MEGSSSQMLQIACGKESSNYIMLQNSIQNERFQLQNAANKRKYHAKWKVPAPKCCTWLAKWKVAAPRCCK
jgi:hypothetical protein